MKTRIVVLAFVLTFAMIMPAWAQWESTMSRAGDPVYPYGPDPRNPYMPYWGRDPRLWPDINVISKIDTQIRNLTREYRAGRLSLEEYLQRKQALVRGN